MKIRVSVTLDVDPQEWARQSGTDAHAPVVRQDVKDWADITLTALVRERGCEAA